MPNEPPVALWRGILDDPNYYIIVAEQDGNLVSTCVLLIVPNLTHSQMPYALIENVVTHAGFRRKHFATELMDRATEIAIKHNCYKIMLLTGSRDVNTLRFYENCGFSRNEKTAFIKRLE